MIIAFRCSFSIYNYTMLNEQVTIEQIKQIVNNEVKKTFKDEFKKFLAAEMKNGSAKDDIQGIVKVALNNLYKFMWTKRNMWNSEIK